MKTSWRAVLVDDEEASRSQLHFLLRAHPAITVVGQASCGQDAIELCRDLQPDILFLDVHMPNGDGFSVVSKLEPVPAIIFVTSYDKYAVRAFEVNAADYILKPIRSDRLGQAIARVMYVPRPTPKTRYRIEDRVFLTTESGCRIVFVPQICGIESEGNYTRVRLEDGSAVFMRRTLTEWQKLLPTEHFLRVGRSFLVRLTAVTELSVVNRDEAAIRIDGFSAPMSLTRRESANLRKALRESNRM